MNQEEKVDNWIIDKHISLYKPDVRSYLDLITDKTLKRKAMLNFLSIEDRETYITFIKLKEKEIYCSERASETIECTSEYAKVADEKRKEHGEVMTPSNLVEEMLDKLPNELFINPNLKWLDPCNGVGTFPAYIIKRLMIGLKDFIEDDCDRYKHIIENMIYVCEIQPLRLFLFHCTFDFTDEYELNTYNNSFLEKDFNKHMTDVWGVEKFDIVLGNPPYKVGVHHKFVAKSFELLNDGGHLLFVHPSTIFVNRKNVRRNIAETKVINMVNDKKTELTLLKGKDYFNIDLYVPLSITYVHNINQDDILVNNNFSIPSIIENVNCVSEIYIHGNPLVKTIRRKVESKNLPNIESRMVHNFGDGDWYFVFPKFIGTQRNDDRMIPIDLYNMIRKTYENDYSKIITNDINSNLKGIYMSLETEQQSINVSRYVLTKFARFCLSFGKVNQELRTKELEMVPFMNPNILWTDEMLFEYFELTQEEINFINSFISDYYEIDFQNN